MPAFANGPAVGRRDGCGVGTRVGSRVGTDVGWRLGCGVGTSVGSRVGTGIGERLGYGVGTSVGSRVGTGLHSKPYQELVQGSPGPAVVPIQFAFAVQLLLPPVLSYKATSADTAGQGAALGYGPTKLPVVMSHALVDSSLLDVVTPLLRTASCRRVSAF